jgi:hypothetical protein
MGQDAGTARGLEKGEKPSIKLGPEKSLKGFRKEKVRIGKKKFVQAEALEHGW